MSCGIKVHIGHVSLSYGLYEGFLSKAGITSSNHPLHYVIESDVY